MSADVYAYAEGAWASVFDADRRTDFQSDKLLFPLMSLTCQTSAGKCNRH